MNHSRIRKSHVLAYLCCILAGIWLLVACGNGRARREAR